MSENEKIELYEDQPIRTAWNETEEECYFSIVDVVGVLTDQPDIRHAAKYWSVLKTRLKRKEEIFRHYADGETVRSIVEDFNNRGPKTKHT